MAGLEYEDERQAIETKVRDGWLALGDPIKVAYPNSRFTQPSPGKGVVWMRLAIINGESFQRSLGPTPCHRLPGQIVGQFFVAEESGTNEIRTNMDSFLAIFLASGGVPLEFSAANSGRIRTLVGWITNDGINDGWQQYRAIIPFTRDIQLAP